MQNAIITPATEVNAAETRTYKARPEKEIKTKEWQNADKKIRRKARKNLTFYINLATKSNFRIDKALNGYYTITMHDLRFNK